MLYLLEVDAMVAAIVAGIIFTVSGLLIVSMLAMRQVTAFASAHRIHKQRALPVRQPLIDSHLFGRES